MNHDAPDSRWRCRTCGTRYVVPTLARNCEARHAQTSTTPREGGRLT